MTAEGPGIIRVGRAGLPRHDAPVRNAATLSDVLGRLRDRPDVVGLSEIDPAAIEIGLVIKRAREERRLSQAELAQRTGLKQSAISLIESGKGPDGPTYRVLRAISLALGLVPHLLPAGIPGELAAGNLAVDAMAAAMAKLRTWETVRLIDDSQALCLVEEARTLDGATPLLHSLLSNPVRAEVSRAVADILRARRGPAAVEQPLCSYWSVAPFKRGRLAAKRGLLVMGYGGQGTVRRPSRPSIVASDKVVVVPRQSQVEIANTGDQPFGFMTIPVTPDVASCLDVGRAA